MASRANLHYHLRIWRFRCLGCHYQLLISWSGPGRHRAAGHFLCSFSGKHAANIPRKELLRPVNHPLGGFIAAPGRRSRGKPNWGGRGAARRGPRRYLEGISERLRGRRRASVPERGFEQPRKCLPRVRALHQSFNQQMIFNPKRERELDYQSRGGSRGNIPPQLFRHPPPAPSGKSRCSAFRSLSSVPRSANPARPPSLRVQPRCSGKPPPKRGVSGTLGAERV